MIRDGPRQGRRQKRKAKGLPASQDVAVPATMHSSLRVAAEAFLGHPIDAALAATPNLVALYNEDVDDAFEYLSLKSLDRSNYLYELFREPAAVEASHGIGICHHPEDHDTCLEELKQMNDTSVLTVLYTKDALCVEISIMYSVGFYWPIPSEPTSMDFTLGSDAKHDNPKEEYYWEAVKDRIIAGVVVNGRGTIEKSFLFGESADDHHVRCLLEDTLAEIQSYVPDLYVAADPVFAASRGAAEIARRGGLWDVLN